MDGRFWTLRYYTLCNSMIVLAAIGGLVGSIFGYAFYGVVAGLALSVIIALIKTIYIFRRKS